MRRLRLYVGCSLTQAPLEFREMVEKLKDLLREEYEILDFIGLVNGTPTDVYKWDIHKCVAICDIFVAICDYPAIGLGYEMGVAIEKHGKPTLGLAHEDSKVSRLVFGIDHPNYSWKQYRTFQDIVVLIREVAQQHFPQQIENLCDIGGRCTPAPTTSNVSNCIYCGKELVQKDGKWYTWDADLHPHQSPQNAPD